MSQISATTVTSVFSATLSNDQLPVFSGSHPVNSSAPVVSGTAQVGQTLTCTNGTWTGTGITYTRQWFYADSGAAISGATSATYLLAAGDAGHTILCKVTASNTGGSATANSNTTGIVAASLMPKVSPFVGGLGLAFAGAF